MKYHMKHIISKLNIITIKFIIPGNIKFMVGHIISLEISTYKAPVQIFGKY